MPKNSIKGAVRQAAREDKNLRTAVKDAAAIAAGRKTKKAFNVVTLDSFQNFVAQLGVGTGNLTSFNTYGFNPITRIHTLLEWIHRGSWIGGVAVDIVADDMTRAGISLKGNLKPNKIEEINEASIQFGVWPAVNDVIKWSRLFGGAIGVLLIDGQDPSKEFRIKTVGKDSFKGILPLDRWMIEPDLNNLVTDYGPHLGLPSRYRVNASAPAFTGKWIHYSRCIRMEGIRLPYWQRLIENLWGLSVLERLYDRMTAFDAASTGAAQLVHKLHVRTYKIEDLRSNIANGEAALLGLTRYVDMMRKFQSIEGMTLMDKDDDFEAAGSPAVAGVSDLILQFGQQLAGALQIPLVRLFGQSPVGLNATGESDLRMYYDGILQQQEARLRVPITTVYRCIAQSLGIKLPDGFGTRFNPLWQMTDKEKAEVAQTVSSAVSNAFDSAIISQQTAMRELRQNSEITGIFSNITDEDIEAAEIELPPGLPEKEEVAEIKTKGKNKGNAGDADTSCFACGRSLKNVFQFPCKTSDGQRVVVGPECYKNVKTAGKEGWQPPKGGPKLFLHSTAADAAHTSAGQLAWHHDLQIVIENPQGTERRGYGWTVKMPADYGYVRRVDGADGDALDCYIGPRPDSTQVFIIDQRRLQDGEFDEHKVMLGYLAQETAMDDYILGYTDGKGQDRMMACTPATMDEFREWMKTGDLTKPYSK